MKGIHQIYFQLIKFISHSESIVIRPILLIQITLPKYNI